MDDGGFSPQGSDGGLSGDDTEDGYEDSALTMGDKSSQPQPVPRGGAGGPSGGQVSHGGILEVVN